MKNTETREFLDELKSEYIILSNEKANKLYNRIIFGAKSYGLYVHYKNFYDLRNPTEVFDENFEMPLNAKLIKTTFNNGPENHYLINLLLIKDNLKIKIYPEAESENLVKKIEEISSRHNIKIKIVERGQKRIEHALGDPMHRRFMEWKDHELQI